MMMFDHMTKKQEEFLVEMINGENQRINILEGSVRSGKTYISLIAWIMLLCTLPKSSKYLMVGKTITSLKRNCLTILEEICPKKDFTYSINRKEAMIFDHHVFLEGVSDSRAEQKIRGMTLQAAYCDELTLFSEDFFMMLLSRLSLAGAFLLGTTNPDTPNHWLMRNYISREDLQIRKWKFYLDDNDTIPNDIRENMKKEYTGVFYDRFILGKWVQAEGLIYKQFADEKDKYLIDAVDKSNLDLVQIGIDYGASASKTAFVAVGFTDNFKKIRILDEYTSSGVTSPEVLYQKFKDFYNRVLDKFGFIYACYADWGGLGQIITRGLQQYCRKNNMNIQIKDCEKLRIIERIQFVCRMISTERFYVMKDCSEVVESLSSAIWDPNNEDTRLDDGTFNVDVLDAMEYAITSKMNMMSFEF